MKKTIFLSLFLAVSPFFTGAQVGGNFMGKSIQFTTDGNVSLDGHCFGNVDSLPTSNGQNVGLRFSDSAMAYHGNLFFKGPIHDSSDTFAGASKYIKGGGDTVASVAHMGSFYLKGACVNTEGCSNTKYEPDAWNDLSNCYAYANDVDLGHAARPGIAQYIGLGLPPGYNFSDSITPSIMKSLAESDGLIFVSDSFPGNNYDCGKGHLVLGVVAENVDFHWYRLDQKNGFWSSKNQPSYYGAGHGPVTNLESTCARDNQDDYPPCDSTPLANPLLDTGMAALGYSPAGFFCTCGHVIVVVGPGDL